MSRRLNSRKLKIFVVAKGTEGLQNPELSIGKRVGVQARSSNVPPDSHDAACISGRVVPATTHRVAEVRSNQKDDTLAHGNSRLFKAVEALRRGKIIALPTVRSGFPCD